MNSEYKDDRICLQLKGPCRGGNVYKLLVFCFINVIVPLFLSLEIVFQDRDTSPPGFSQTLPLTSSLWVRDMPASNRLAYPLPLFSFVLSLTLLSPFFSLPPFLFTLCPLSMPLLSGPAVSLCLLCTISSPCFSSEEKGFKKAFLEVSQQAWEQGR